MKHNCGHTKRDYEYLVISNAMRFVTNNETAMEMLFCIKTYEKQYPSYYKLTFLKEMWLTQIDKMDSRLDTI